MGKVTIDAMREAFGTKPEDLVCAIGPSICQDCYEVGEDVADEFRRAFPGHEELLKPQKDMINRTGMRGDKAAYCGTGQADDGGNRKLLLDLWRANEIVLTEAGVLSSNIAVTDICTCCNPDILFSHRASHGRRGNLGAFLSLI
jgi:hypothetical protein